MCNLHRKSRAALSYRIIHDLYEKNMKNPFNELSDDNQNDAQEFLNALSVQFQEKGFENSVFNAMVGQTKSVIECADCKKSVSQKQEYFNILTPNFFKESCDEYPNQSKKGKFAKNLPLFSLKEAMDALCK